MYVLCYDRDIFSFGKRLKLWVYTVVLQLVQSPDAELFVGLQYGKFQ